MHPSWGILAVALFSVARLLQLSYTAPFMNEHELPSFLAVFTAGRLARPSADPGNDLMLAAAAPFADVVLAIDRDGKAIVDLGEGRVGVVERSDLDCLLVRAWLFGLITSLERRLRHDLAAQASWQVLLSPERLKRAHEVKDERVRRGLAANTLACLQFGDLGQMGVRTSWWQRLMRLDSNKQAKALAKRLELLRNDLAHGQETIAEHWETVVVLASNVYALKT